MKYTDMRLIGMLGIGYLAGCGTESRPDYGDVDRLLGDGNKYCEMIAGMTQTELQSLLFPKGDRTLPWFSDVTYAVGLPRSTSTATPTGDINNDGWADVLIDHTLYLNCGGEFFPLDLESRITDPNGPKLLNRITAGAIRDLDGDDKPEIILAGGGTNAEGGAPIQILKNQGGLTFSIASFKYGRPFEEFVSALSFSDLDHNGETDIYASVTLTGAPRPFENAPDIILLQKNGKFSKTVFPELEQCNRYRTYGTTKIPRGQFNAKDLFVIVNDIGSHGNYEICLYEIHGSDDTTSFREIDIEQPLEEIRQQRALTSGGAGGIINGMGVSFAYKDNTGHVIITVSDAGNHMPTLLVDHYNRVTNITDTLSFGDVPYQQVTWKNLNIDIDNDGYQDNIAANGVYQNRGVTLRSGQAHESASPQYLLLLMNDGRGILSNYADSAGNVFTTPADTYDIAGIDYNHTGCASFLVTPKAIPTEMVSGLEEEYRYTTTLTLIKNECDYKNNRIVASIDPAIEMLMIATGNRVMYRAESPQLASSSEASIIVGLGGIADPVNLKVRCTDGRQLPYGTVDANSHVNLIEYCKR